MTSATLVVACAQPQESGPVASHTQRLAYMDSLRYYEMEVPLDADFERIRNEGVGLFPSAADHGDALGWWAVALLDDRGVERALELGLDPQLAPRAALEERRLRSLDAAAAARGDAELVVDDGDPGADAPYPDCDLRGRWCQYEGDEGCGDGLALDDQLRSLEAQYQGWAEVVAVGWTGDGNMIRGLRVGVLSDAANDPLHPVNQVVLFGTQHAREWAATGIVMDLAKRTLADISAHESYQELMSDRSVLFLPVVNPDGYEYAFSATGNRLWRKNRQLCTEEPPFGPCASDGSCVNGKCNPVNEQCYEVGVDTNRNFAFSWGDTEIECESEVYEGTAPGSALETGLLDRFLLHQSLPGHFVTRLYVNYHAYGDLLLYADGMSDDDHDSWPHNPCRRGFGTNCQPPEFGLLRHLGSGGTPGWETMLLGDLGGSYRADTVYRLLYAAPGDEVSHHGYSYAIADDRRAIGFSAEVTNGPEGFHAECIEEAGWQNIVTTHLAFSWNLLQKADDVSSASAAAATYGLFLAPRIHRILSDDDIPSVYEYGPPKIYVDFSTELDSPTISPIAFANVGESLAWNTRGLFYVTEQWRNSTPNRAYVFPRRFNACATVPGFWQVCQEFRTDAAGNPPELNLCTPTLFTQANGWAWVGPNGQGLNDCNMRVSSTGNGPFVLVRRAGSMVGADNVQLNFSYRIDRRAFYGSGGVSVYVQAPGRPTKLVRSYPHRFGGSFGDFAVDQEMRSESVVLPAEYANTANITVRFEAKSIQPGFGDADFAFEVYDVALVGRAL